MAGSPLYVVDVIPNGGPGLENRLHMIHEFGVRAGRISVVSAAVTT